VKHFFTLVPGHSGDKSDFETASLLRLLRPLAD
jgi:hypothetical protein